jgi:hypothetical protein
MTTPLDKNGRAIEHGSYVRLLKTQQDYLAQRVLRVHDLNGELKLYSSVDSSYTPLSNYRNEDTNYHSVELA